MFLHVHFVYTSVCKKHVFSMLFEDPFCTKCNKWPNATLWKRISLCILHKNDFVIIVCFVRIHSVQRVINNPALLSGRGFPCIFYTKLFLLQFYVVWCSQMEAESCMYILLIFRLLCKHLFFSMLFEDPFCTQCKK